MPDGSHDLQLNNGLKVSFDWTNNPTADGQINFEIIIHPYKTGDVFSKTYSIEGGRLNVELRRQFDFALIATSGTPTIGDSIVAPDLPFVDIQLGN